ncbi:hypothetical protein DM02DRAFT_84270 [Periconia macrospinosa]|uniref:AMP-activated protein kinase glycogen-binding domain-containing protein n=1 Tax=Periconia macrospinosa TaxID=97972 RepID=A0A2V1E523_9PLEO|nr:hypothetical protein DM02DRAFT_84270 [Periconia macrospinosa]
MSYTYLKSRPHAAKKTISKLWHGGSGSTKQKSLTTDDLPSARVDPALRNGLVRQFSNPLDSSHALRRTYRLPRFSKSSITLHSSFDKEAKMVTRASITFEHPGAERPVYVVTDMSSPPWELLEMQDSGQRNEAGDIIFVREFDNVTEGNHQYKIRIGDGNWVLDSSKDTASDGAGHLNNIVHAATVKYTHHPSEEDVSSQEQPVGIGKRRQDSVQFSSDVPFLALNEAQDKGQLENGVTVPEKRSINKPKIDIGIATEDFALRAQADSSHSVSDKSDTIELTSSEESGRFLSEEDKDVSELDLNRTFPHEQAQSSEGEDGLGLFNELDRAPSFSHETASSFGGLDILPLLSPESSAATSPSGKAHPGASSSADKHRPSFGGGGPEFSHEEGQSDEHSGALSTQKSPGKSSFKPYRSDLPHSMALRDSDEELLVDSSVETFPTNRRDILERISTIEASYPVDQPEGAFMSANSPEALSQACSSVEMAPVKSYTSLTSIPETTMQEEDEIDEVPSLPSPVLKVKSEEEEDETTSPTSTASAESKGKGKEPSPNKSPIEKYRTLLAPAQVLHNAREDFISRGMQVAAENEAARRKEQKQEHSSSTTQLAGPPVGLRDNPDPYLLQHSQRKNDGNERLQQQGGGWVSRFLAPVRRCFGAGPEDQSL